VEVRTTSSRVLRLARELRKQASGEERLFFAVELVAEGVLEWKYGLRLRESYVSLESGRKQAGGRERLFAAESPRRGDSEWTQYGLHQVTLNRTSSCLHGKEE
jgi:hypothetical protein